MDGTLLDTLSDMQDAVNHILLENGWPQRTTEEIRAFVGNGAAKLMERAIPEPFAPQRFFSRDFSLLRTGTRPIIA